MKRKKNRHLRFNFYSKQTIDKSQIKTEPEPIPAPVSAQPAASAKAGRKQGIIKKKELKNIDKLKLSMKRQRTQRQKFRP